MYVFVSPKKKKKNCSNNIAELVDNKTPCILKNSRANYLFCQH